VFCFFYSCVLLLLTRQISPWGLIKYISIYLSIYDAKAFAYGTSYLDNFGKKTLLSCIK